jgi:hypothetical protein
MVAAQIAGFGVLRRLRQRALLERCWRGLRAWAAAGAFCRGALTSRALAALRGAAEGARAREARADAARRRRALRSVLGAWKAVSTEQVGRHSMPRCGAPSPPTLWSRPAATQGPCAV